MAMLSARASPMTSVHEFCGQVLLPEGFRSVRVLFGQVVEQIRPDDSAPQDVYLVPGFIDTHVHGGGGGDTMDGPEGVRRLARLHARHGTTSLLPTTMTAPWSQVLAALHGVREVMVTGVPDGADIPGAHLEGPFISPARLGAQPPHAILPTDGLLTEVLALGVVRAVTLAPELTGALDAARRFAQAGVRVGLGHTAGRYEDAVSVLDAVRAEAGRSAGTHTFNAMGGVQGRDPGPLAALLGHPDPFLELIVDDVHLHPGAVRLALVAAPDRALLITDAIRATGMPDGPSELGGQAVIVRDGKASLADGTLAGSVLTMDRGVRELVRLGVPLAQAASMASSIPARSLGLTDRGRIAPGLRADLVVLGADLCVRQVYLAGRAVHEEVTYA